MPLLELPPGYRQRALADLDRLIAHLEGDAPPQLQTPKREAVPAQATKHAGRMRPSPVADRLVLLRRSRQFLLAGRLSREGDGRSSARPTAA
jgi:hypothetical protein